MTSLKLISATDTQYSATVLKSMNEQRSHGLFCDVTIIIQDKKFRAHKTILSASSTYFHQLFSVAGQVIELNFIRAEIFEVILNYIYSSKIVRVRSDMLEELISGGKILGVKFIANLGVPLAQVKGLPGLSKETESKGDMPIIAESFSISAEEFNQARKKAEKDAEKDADSDNDVMFISKTRAVNQKKPSEIIDLDAADSKEDLVSNQNKEKCKDKEESGAVTKVQETSTAPLNTDSAKSSEISTPPKTLPEQNHLGSPDTSSNKPSSSAQASPGSAPTTQARSTSRASEPPSTAPKLTENLKTTGIHKKQVSTTPQKGDFKIRLSDVSAGMTNDTGLNIPKPVVVAKKTITLDKASEIDSISTGCKVYANIGEDTYDIVPVKEDPGEGGSRSQKGKRSFMATPLKPYPYEEPISPKGGSSKKNAKMELEDHYEITMDGKTFFVCIVCKRPYVCVTSLRRHFNTHSWEKKYPCHYCDKVFALAEYRTKHEMHHTGERRYQCLLCDEMFMNYQVLSSHCKQAHNQDPSGRKQKDDTDNNLYRLHPCRTLQMKSYSWASEDGAEIPVLSEDGSVHHLSPEEAQSSAQSKMLNWDDIFVEPDAHMRPGAHARPGTNMNPAPLGSSEFEFVIPETY